MRMCELVCVCVRARVHADERRDEKARAVVLRPDAILAPAPPEPCESATERYTTERERAREGCWKLSMHYSTLPGHNAGSLQGQRTCPPSGFHPPESILTLAIDTSDTPWC